MSKVNDIANKIISHVDEIKSLLEKLNKENKKFFSCDYGHTMIELFYKTIRKCNDTMTSVAQYNADVLDAISQIKELEGYDVLDEAEYLYKVEAGAYLAQYIDYPLKEGDKVRITFSMENMESNYDSSYDVNIGFVFTELGQQTITYVHKLTDEFIYGLPQDSTQIAIYIDGGAFIKNDTVTLKIEKLARDIDSLKGKTFSIIGDSYSSYEGWIPSNYSAWYSDNGNALDNDVSDVSHMWWYKLMKDTGMKLLYNSSYSGSTVCNTGYDGVDSTSTSFITRMKSDLGEDKTIECKPDIIFVYGGSNDAAAGVPEGENKYSDWTEDDLKQFAPSVCYMLWYIKKYNPQARIIYILNDFGYNIYMPIYRACDTLGIECYCPLGIAKENYHPNQEGMESIAKQIKYQLKI